MRHRPHPLADLFPRLDGDDLQTLADDIADNGLHHAVVIYDGQVLDGRNRLAACELANVEPTFETFTGTEEEALALVISLNLQRRHLTTAQKAVLALSLLPFEEEAARRRQGTRTDLLPPGEGSDGGTALELAGARVGVSKNSVWRAREVDKQAPEVFAAMKDGTVATIGDAQKLASFPQPKRRRLLTRMRRENLSLSGLGSPFRKGNGSTQWFTPPMLLDPIREALGGEITLDPASCDEAQVTVRARRYYTVEDNGLTKPWRAARVLVNPPYGHSAENGAASSQGQWAKKALEEYDAGRAKKIVLVVRPSTEAEWWWKLWRFPVVFVRGRVSFIPGPGSSYTRPTIGTGLICIGIDPEHVVQTLGHLGRVVLPTGDDGVSVAK